LLKPRQSLLTLICHCRAKNDGTYVVEFRTALGESLAISIPGNEAGVIRHFQERMPYGLFVPDVP